MKQNRLEIILHRNQKSVVFDLLLALVFVVAAMMTAVAMRTALHQLAGVPVVSSSDPAPLTGNGAPCAAHAAADPRGDLLAFSSSSSVSHAAGASLPR